MAKILIRVKQVEARALLEKAIEEAGHKNASFGDSPENKTTQQDLVDLIINQDAALVIMDFFLEDALSVKVMQSVRDRQPFTKFIFVLDDKTTAEDMTHAMNEGASALLPLPLTIEAATHHINRSVLNRNKEKAAAEELDRSRRLINTEDSRTEKIVSELARTKRLLSLNYRLINRLLAQRAPGGKKKKLLLVSDSAYQLDRLRSSLESADFKIVSAKDGNEGLKTARAEKPDIIVSDLEMPGLSGVELCKAVKEEEGLSNSYFVICTANGEKIEQVLSPENKVDDCLLKPGRAEEFDEFTARVALGILT